MHIVTHCGHSFLREPLGASSTVVDCGVNNGDFSRWISENTQARILGFEPDPRLYPKLPALPRATFFPVAVSDHEHELTLMLGETRCSSAFYQERDGLTAATVRAVSLSAFLADKGVDRIDLLKLDIEGAEIPVLLALPPEFLARVAQITVEFHDFLDSADIPRILECERRLDGLGFVVMRMTHFTHGDVLFVNRALLPLSAAARLKLLAVDKYGRGIRRFIRRKVG